MLAFVKIFICMCMVYAWGVLADGGSRAWWCRLAGPHRFHIYIDSHLHKRTPNKYPQIESYTYLTHEDAAHQGGDLAHFWGPNTALGWAVENIGDLDGA